MHPKLVKSMAMGLFAMMILGSVAQGAEYEFQWVSGDSVTLAPEGAVWLYHYSYGPLQRFKLGDIHKGKARIELDAKSLEENVKPPSNTEAYVLVLEFPANRWYRSANIAPTNLLRDFLPALDSLGTLRESSSKSLRKLVLPAFVTRRFQFLSSEGAPRVGESIPVAIYVSDHNHCAAHEGLPLGAFTTDERGWLVVPAPEVPLYLDLSYWQPDGQGFAGQMYALSLGMKVDSRAEVIRLKWSLPSATWEFWLRTPEGKPIPKASLVEWIRIKGCGANSGLLGVTDSQGFVRVTLQPQSVERLAFQMSTKIERALSDEELDTLWCEKKLTVTWQGQGR